MTIKKLTEKQLKKIVKEEMTSFGKEIPVEDVKAEETEADDLADTLEKDIDMLKVLKIKEAKLVESLKKVRRMKDKIKKSL